MKKTYTCEIDEIGTKRWKLNGQLHRTDGPAIECTNGDKWWYVDDKLHRTDGPAVEFAGHKEWFIDGKRLTETEFNKEIEKLKMQPTCETDEQGNKRWILNNKLHRLDGPAIEYADSDKEWWVNGKLHRLDGPAVEYVDRDKEWYVNGLCHRIDGPAIEYADGYKVWCIDGKRLTETEFNKEIEKLKLQPTLEIDEKRTKSWKSNGQLHRLEWANGDKAWYTDGKLHRLDGPAIEFANGSKFWYVDGNQLSKDEFEKEILKPKKFPQINVDQLLSHTSNPEFEKLCQDPVMKALRDRTVNIDVPYLLKWKESIENKAKLSVVLNKVRQRTKNTFLVSPQEIESQPTYDESGNKRWCETTKVSKSWYLNDKLHRKNGPAIEHTNGDKYWYVNGERHRIDGPAVEWADGTKAWYVNGKRHRLDGPAVEFANGVKYWWIEGSYLTEAEFNKEIEKLKLQPTCETDKNGNKLWKLNGLFHRVDGPAIEWANGHKEWFVNGKLHRLDGPAVEYVDGDKEWWIDGKRLTETEFNEKVKKTTSIPTAIPAENKITLNIPNAIIFNTINAALFTYTAFMTEINIIQPKTPLDLAANMWYIMTMMSSIIVYITRSNDKK